MENVHCYDVVIIGGGPAGSTAATVLAEKGRRVAVLEKERFPRYHVGESLLPYCYFPLQRIGMIDKLKQSAFIKKHSVQFVRCDGRVSAPFYFFQHLDHEASQTWQVSRSKLDQMLIENAEEFGASIFYETAAKQILTHEDTVIGVQAQKHGGERVVFKAPITIDCSGRDGFSMTRNNWRVRDPQLSKIAIWTYYRGAVRDQGIDEGATTVAYVPEKGWFWYIPLADDMVSVGITAEQAYLYRHGKDLQEIFTREIASNIWVEQHLAPAERVERFWVTGDYSYRSRFCAVDGLVLAGDAFAFLDPVFSSGIFLALRSGEMVADAVDSALTDGDLSAGQFSEYSEQLCGGIEAMRKLVYAFYDKSFNFGHLLDKYPDLRGDLTDCLIGNLFRDFDPLFDAIAQFADIPRPLTYGGPQRKNI